MKHMMLLMALKKDGKLTDKFLPPGEFQIVQTKPYPEWPKKLKEKLAPWTEKWKN
jgi:hypothetical protein